MTPPFYRLLNEGEVTAHSDSAYGDYDGQIHWSDEPRDNISKGPDSPFPERTIITREWLLAALEVVK